jgi:2-polyprenyl-6-methoxyphenol hydroxylase-like FAD-dependent oxidoreductase
MNNHGLIDVLIVGAGPTGSALAIDLTRRGLKVRILEKGQQSFGGSRAKGVQPRSLEVLEDLGVLEDILAGGSLYPKVGLHLGPFTIPWKMFTNREPTHDVPYPNTWLIPQFRIDRALHAGFERMGGKVELGKELIEFTQNLDTVACRVSTPDGVEQITARYLVGADGGSSVVRTHLGLNFIGSTDEEDRILIVDAATSGLARNRWHMWPGKKGRFVSACPLPHSDVFQWMIRLLPEETPPREFDAIVARLQERVRNPEIQLHGIQWQSVFRPNIRLAERYRRGRVFLAGDAAHVHTPAGAQGLNTGIQDAYNLGWKLAQVLAGAPAELLDTYEGERQPIAAGVLGLSTKKYQGIAKLDPSALRRGKDEQQLQLTYHGGQLAPIDGERTRTLHVGDRAPDALLRRPNGQQIRLFDLYNGPHFTAVAFGDHAARACNCLPWPTSGASLKRIVVNAAVEAADVALADPSRAFERIHGLTGDALLLIRPDGYIGHIATRDMLESTTSVVRMLAPAIQGSRHASAALASSVKESLQ